MIFHLNLLHLVLVLSAMAAVYFALRENRGRVMRHRRLFSLPLLAMVVALILLLFQLAAHQPAWTFAVPFGLGLAGGALRGATMKLEVDQNWHLVRPTGRRALFWVSLALPIAIGLEIAGTLAGAPGTPLRLAGAHVAILCTGLLVGRALVLAVRLWRAPHVDLRR
ncbi:MAG: hypothetical protein Q8L22_12540 [Reyranella sp.]|nr:hypothetical protein [Reyranella sp.]